MKTLRDSTWPSRRLSEVTQIQSGGTPRRDTGHYWANGSIPWITTSEVDGTRILATAQHITEAGLRDSSAKLFPAGTVLVAMYGQGKTRGQVGITGMEAATNQASAALIAGNKMDPEFLFQCLSNSYEELRGLSNSGGQDNLSAALVGAFRVPVPPLPEQRKIAEILSTWDDAIERLESALARKVARRTAVVYQLVFGPGAPHGTRWSQTASSWNIQRIERVAREVSERNSGLAAEAVLTCSKHRGFVLSADYFSRSVHSADLRNYKLIANGQFGFPSNHIEEGSIGLQNVLSLGAVSPIYTVFEFDPKSVDATFAYLVLKSRPYLQMFEASTNSSVDRRGSLRWPDFSLLPFPVPPLPTQQHIATIAQDLDQEIALVSKEIDLLADQKRGLMQKLLTGDVRVNVELDQDSGRDQQ